MFSEYLRLRRRGGCEWLAVLNIAVMFWRRDLLASHSPIIPVASDTLIFRQGGRATVELGNREIGNYCLQQKADRYRDLHSSTLTKPPFAGYAVAYPSSCIPRIQRSRFTY